MQERMPVRQVLPLTVMVSRPGRHYVKQWCLWRERGGEGGGMLDGCDGGDRPE